MGRRGYTLDDARGQAEKIEIVRQTRPIEYTSEDIMAQSSRFSTLSLPYLDYLYLDLGSLISLVTVNESIRNDQFPALKVLDIDGLRQSDGFTFGMGKETVFEGLELLVSTCKERGIMLASEGKPIETMADLWWHLEARPARRGSLRDLW